METLLRRTWAEIDLDALSHNYTVLKQLVGEHTKVLGVVKADAYGHGAIQVAKTLEQLGAGYLAVSSLDEARELRHAGITMPILLLGHTPEEYVEELIALDITQTVTCEAKALAYSQRAKSCQKPLKIHIKVDTGMSRLGFLTAGRHFEGGIVNILRACSLEGLHPEGIFTHFAVADEPGEENRQYTREQFSLFCRVIETLEKKGLFFALRHCANSGAVAFYREEMKLDMVRPGILLYGCGPEAKTLGLQPVMSLKTTVSTIKTYDEGVSVSYGRLYQTEKTTRMGVLPIGYADGLFRSLSSRFSVYTEDGSAPQRGRICMDMCMVELSGLDNVQVGSEIEIFGRHSSVEQLASIAGTIPYELLCAVSKRVPRIYLRQGEPIETELRMLF